MDRQLIESYIELIRDSHSLGSVFGIYFHDIKDELPPLAYDYSDDLTVCSSVVLKLECGNYVFVSDAKVSPRDPSVRLFCGSNVQMMNPLLAEYKTFFRHFFPAKQTLEVYEGFNHSSLDRDGSIHSLLSLYSCIITDRAIKFNLLESQNLHNEIVSSFRRSVDSKKLLKFVDSIFIPSEKIRPDVLYFVEIFSTEEMSDYKKSKDVAAREAFKKKLQTQSAKRQAESSLTDSDDDFEQPPKYRCSDQAGPKQVDETSELPKFSSFKRADPAVSKRRLDSIKKLASISVNDLSSVINSTSVIDPGQASVDISAGVDGEQSVGHDQSSSSSTDVRNQHVAPAQSPGPSTADADRDQHVADELDQDLSTNHPFGSVQHIENVLKTDDVDSLKSYKREMTCRNVSCIRVKTTRVLHFHCLLCKSYSYRDFKRVVTHMLKCSAGRSFITATSLTSTSVIDSTLVIDPGQPSVQISAGVDGEQSVGHDQSSSSSTDVRNQHVAPAQSPGPF